MPLRTMVATVFRELLNVESVPLPIPAVGIDALQEEHLLVAAIQSVVNRRKRRSSPPPSSDGRAAATTEAGWRARRWQPASGLRGAAGSLGRCPQGWRKWVRARPFRPLLRVRRSNWRLPRSASFLPVAIPPHLHCYSPSKKMEDVEMHRPAFSPSSPTALTSGHLCLAPR